MHNFIRNRMTAVGLSDSVQNFIVDEMTAPHRHYHTMAHLSLMLKQIDQAYSRNLIETKDAIPIVVATLFHDIVYDPKASDNEERSTIEAKLRLGKKYNLPLISSLIMATKTHDLSKYMERTDPHYWIIYADLSILWAKPQTYSWYAHGVRKEYAHVPADLYRKGRANIINRLTAELDETFAGVPCWNLEQDLLPRLLANRNWELAHLSQGEFDVA